MVEEKARSLPGLKGTPTLQISLEDIQRQRLAIASLLGLALNFIAIIIHILLFGLRDSLPSIWTSFIIALIAGTCLYGSVQGKKAIRFARPSILVITALIWFEVTKAGGIVSHGSALMLLMPIISALLLPARDTLFLTLATIFAIAGLGVMELNGVIGLAEQADPEPELLGTMGIMIIVTAGGAGAMIVLVRQNEQVDRNLRILLEQQAYLASHDTLTGLCNRSAVNTKLDDICGANDAFDIYLIDLDGFKAVNDQRGHGAGDILLRKVARRLQRLSEDKDFVARLGGDEFVFIVPHQETASRKTCQKAASILKALSQPFAIGKGAVQISGSIGRTTYPHDGQSKSQLLGTADLALYAAKKAGKNRYEIFHPSLFNNGLSEMRQRA